MTELQKLIIKSISKEFHNKDKLEEISKEYKEIFGTDLNEDYQNWKNKFNRIVSNSRKVNK